MVGTLGNKGLRLAEVTARALSLPAWMYCKELPSTSNITFTWPPSRSLSAGPAPL